ncbi:hypothetical protein K402DRAFT_332867, partial [Aulographum hederae CBS 113979]
MERSRSVKSTWLSRLLKRPSERAPSDQLLPFAESIQELARIGGVSSVNLPTDLAVPGILIPTCLAATANYLIAHGRTTPGIFRISGQTRIVTALYNHYMSQIHAHEGNAPQSIETTIRTAVLPSDVNYVVHDIASAFKKFLNEIPGGLLGSMKIFRELAAIIPGTLDLAVDPDHSEESQKKALRKPIAMILSGADCNERLCLIVAVFGLLAHLTASSDRTPPSPHHDPTARTEQDETMSPRAFAIVFAPLFVGDL